jgi:hypothetical protein
MHENVGGGIRERLFRVVIDVAERMHFDERIVDLDVAAAHRQDREWALFDVLPELRQNLGAFAPFGEVEGSEQKNGAGRVDAELLASILVRKPEEWIQGIVDSVWNHVDTMARK